MDYASRSRKLRHKKRIVPMILLDSASVDLVNAKASQSGFDYHLDTTASPSPDDVRKETLTHSVTDTGSLDGHRKYEWEHCATSLAQGSIPMFVVSLNGRN